MVAAWPSVKSQNRGQAAAAFAASSRPLVLIVEDHDDTRFLLKYLITSRGFDVAEAENGEEAVEVAERLHPGLILMDVSLPRLDGISAMRRMRELATLGKVPIIFLSGHAELAAQARARDAGCDDYLVKPLDIGRLDRVLAQYFCVENLART
ncbi:MAG TPA: response regulator [Pyrinomonadaceae bacterium]|nr:response regulator [Pyrinomonadaceae bacterium]